MVTLQEKLKLMRHLSQRLNIFSFQKNYTFPVIFKKNGICNKIVWDYIDFEEHLMIQKNNQFVLISEKIQIENDNMV